MDKVSTYSVLGIPDGFATTLVLIWLCLALAPWVGNTEIGPLKIPRFSLSANRWLRVIGPLGFLLFGLGLLRLWPNDDLKPKTVMQTTSAETDRVGSERETRIEGGSPVGLPEEMARRAIDKALDREDILGAKRILAGLNEGSMKTEECEHLYVYTFNKAKLEDATRIVEMCWQGEERQKRLTDIWIEKQKH